MQQSLLAFYNHQVDAFRENFTKVREEFGFDAIHDMRVAVKRLRAILILAKKLDPNQNRKYAEGKIKQLFRLSGKMRDAQVQQALLKEYESKMKADFGEYATYLMDLEQKSILKFQNYLYKHSTTDFTVDLGMALPALIVKSDTTRVKSAMDSLIGEFFHNVDLLKAQQQKDENLHEIRRQLKQISYLLSAFDSRDLDYPKLNKKIKMLEKANHLLGKWHDHVVAMTYLSRFLRNKDTGDSGGYNPYPLLMDAISTQKHQLYLKIKEMMNRLEGMM